MSQLAEAFVLGNAAILTNVCVLPLYPSMVAYLASDATLVPGSTAPSAVTSADTSARSARTVLARASLGALVLAGVLTLMLAVGLALFLLQRTFGTILPWLLPLVYGGVIALGIMLLVGRSPFARLATANAPVLRNPFLTA